MARSLVWRRNYYQSGGQAGDVVDTNGIWHTYWYNVATLTVGQTLTRCYGSLLFSRLSSAAGDYNSLVLAPILVGIYLQADSAGDTPTITPAANQADQSWLLYDMVSYDFEAQQQWSNDGRQIAKFQFDNHAQRKAKGTGTATTSVKLCYSTLWGSSYPAPEWGLDAGMVASGVLLP